MKNIILFAMADADPFVCAHEEGKCIYHECGCKDCASFNFMSQLVVACMTQSLASIEPVDGFKANTAFMTCVHKFIKCDSCDRIPIVGPRFSCMVCPKFDLCLQCVMSDVHDFDHPLVLVRVPQPVFCTCAEST